MNYNACLSFEEVEDLVFKLIYSYSGAISYGEALNFTYASLYKAAKIVSKINSTASKK